MVTPRGDAALVLDAEMTGDPDGQQVAHVKQAGTPVTASIGAARTEISEPSAQLNELQLDLEFGVESYLDGVLIPEAMVEAYQRSLCEAMGIRAGLEHSSRMLERLSAVIGGRRTALDAAVQEQAERRDRLFSAAGWLLRRRIRASSGQLDVFEGARSERAR
jgi:hypothetical protein